MAPRGLAVASLPPVLVVHFLDTLPSRGRSLRKRLQALEVPLWERDRVPLVCEAGERPGELLAIGDLWLHERLQERKGGRRGRIVWQERR